MVFELIFSLLRKTFLTREEISVQIFTQIHRLKAKESEENSGRKNDKEFLPYNAWASFIGIASHLNN